MSSAYVSVKKYFGKQVLVAIDGKVLRGTLDKLQNGCSSHFNLWYDKV
jgi:hypothetical protein